MAGEKGHRRELSGGLALFCSQYKRIAVVREIRMRTIGRYGLAVVSVAVALAMTSALEKYTDLTPLFYAAIIISAWFGGMGPGLVAVVLATFALDYFFITPLYTLRPDAKQASFLIVFGILAILTSWMSAKRQHAERALREARDELELRVEERTAALQKVQTELAHVTRVMTLGELTASIAHEVNQPLAAIVTNGNATLRWLGGAVPNLHEARLAIERIIKDSYRASEVITRIRAFVKKGEPRNDLVDLNEVIVEVIALAQDQARRSHVHLKRQLEDDLPLVSGDRVQLQQVILNLIVNGLEAIAKSKDGERELTVTSIQDEGGNVSVAVSDSGEGLDPANLERVFDAFFTTKPDGMGMGLAISRTIVEAHGGRLWATKNSPQGTVFQFTLPRNAERAP